MLALPPKPVLSAYFVPMSLHWVSKRLLRKPLSMENWERVSKGLPNVFACDGIQVSRKCQSFNFTLSSDLMSW
eukprot:1683447-Amphidinium_carterae.1